jgi:hypothetical protein
MSQVYTISELDIALNRTPIVYEGEPLLLAELDNIVVERNIWNYVQRSDHLSTMPEARTVLMGPISNYFDRWPVAQVNTRVPSDIIKFNQYLFQHYDQVLKFTFNQFDISAIIQDDLNVDVIVLLLIDGLSYLDWIEYPGVRSCFVPGPTITNIGFQNIIGIPTIAHRLFDLGFRKRIGYSYWGRDESLTNIIFHGFDSSTQMVKVNEIKEVLLTLNMLPSEQTFVQILINGLDSICHRHRGRPPKAALARDLYENVLLAIAENLQKLRVSALVYAVADHGILWKPQPFSEEKFVVIKDERTESRRYAKGSLLHCHAKQFSYYGSNYTVLAYPYLFNPLTNLEWGTHGGISFQESVVPFVKMEVV